MHFVDKAAKKLIVFIAAHRPRGRPGMAKAFCMKCKKSVDIKNPKQVELKNKRLAVAGICSRCGTKVFRMGKL